MNLRKIAEKYIRFKLRLNRGKSFIDELRDLVLLAVALKIFEIPLLLLIPLVLLIVALLYYIGYMDEKKIKSWQYEYRYNTEKLNPFFRKLYNEVKKQNGKK